MSKKRNKVIFIALVVYLVLVGLLIRDRYLLLQLELSVDSPTIKAPSKKYEPPITKDPEPIKVLPASYALEVPFTSQAPFGIWDPLHEEACEEASLLMVYYYRTDQQFASPLEADAEIKKLVAWQENNNYEVSVTVTQLSEIARGYLKLNTGRVLLNPTVEQLKVELAAGRPVIVPAAGRELKNPYFTPPGPIYHMLVLKGYDKIGFIVNDPGTRRGESYHYTFERIMTAMHDWDSVDILRGQKAVVVFD